MTGPELIAATGPYVAPIVVAVGGLIALWVRDRARVATTQKDLREWAQESVREAVESERQTYTAVISQMRADREADRAEITRLHDEVAELRAALADRDERLSEFPDLVEKFVIVVAGIDREKTPSRDQLDALHTIARRLRLAPHVPNHVLLAKVGA